MITISRITTTTDGRKEFSINSTRYRTETDGRGLLRWDTTTWDRQTGEPAGGFWNAIVGSAQLDLSGSNARDHLIRWALTTLPETGYDEWLDRECITDSLAAAREYYRLTH